MQEVGSVSVAFWALALGIMTVAVGYAVRGWRRVRSGEIEAHRRDMIRACWWVGAFLLFYLGKVAFLGHEDLASWSPARHLVVDIHRGIVFSMLGLGAAARWLGPRGLLRGVGARAMHRRLGRVAVLAGALGLATATLVLVQMVAAAWQR